LYFLYGGNTINEELKLGDLPNPLDKKKNKINIMVFEKDNELLDDKEGIIKSKEIICPKCYEICLMKIKDYKISLECKNLHITKNILLDEFENTQKVNISKIICNKCNNNKFKSYKNEFYKCLSCKQNLCPQCKLKHDKSHTKIINYDDKNYICNTHNDYYISYCDKCNKNLCMLCENEHDKGHSIIGYRKIIEDKDKIKKELDEFKTKIDLFIDEIEGIIQKLNKIIDNMKIYFDINRNILENKFEKYEKNYQMLKNIQEIKNNIKLKDIDDIINEKKMDKKLKILMEIYNKMRNEDFLNFEEYSKKDSLNNII
jgi:hypothetical protein